MMSNFVSKTPLPQFDTDEAAQRIVAEADLSSFDLSGGIVVRYEFRTGNAENAISALRPDKAEND